MTGNVPVRSIQPRQFHRATGNLQALVDSMASIGQQVPILVDDVYQVVDGERRLAAARILGWDTISCLATGTATTMIDHITMTNTKQAALNLPAETMRPRDINELTRLLYRFYTPQVTSAIRADNNRRTRSKKPSKTAPRAISRSLNEVMASMLGISVPTMSGIRSIYMIEETADARWPQLADQLKWAIHNWEKDWPDGITASSMRSRLYERIRASGNSGVLAEFVSRAHTSEIVISKMRPTKDSGLLARRQRANMPKGLIVLNGAAAGLHSIGALSRLIPTDELESWLEQIQTATVHLREVTKQIKANLIDQRINEAEPEEKQA